MKLSIIIVNYNTCGLLKQCLESVKQGAGGIDHEIIVIDNASSDESIGMLERDFPEVHILANKYNAGFAKANNQGYRLSQGEYVLLLNSDTIVLDNSLQKLVHFMEYHPETAVTGPRLLNSDMTLQLPCRRGFPRLINSMAHFLRLSRIFPQNRILGSYHMTYRDDSQTHEVDAVSGACMMIRRECIAVLGGLLDEAFFMHFEDIDLCFRAKQQGYKVYYIREAEVIHLKGQSSKFRSEGVAKNFYDSALIYFRKNYKSESLPGYCCLKIIISCMKAFSLMMYKLRAKNMK